MVKKILVWVVYFGLSVGVGLGLLIAAFGIPSTRLEKNTNTSLQGFEAEGTYPSRGFFGRKIVLDNFTDSIMINTAYSVTDNSLRSVLLAERQIVSNSEVDQIKNLRSAIEGTAPIRSSYQRYWHGYLVYLRPLLWVMPYQGIRVVLSLVLFGLFGALLVKLVKQRGYVRGLALLTAAVAVDFFGLGQSLQFSQVFLVGLIMALVSLSRDRRTLPLFFITGMLTAFFDLLTAPLITLGLLVLTNKETKIKQLIQQSGIWGAGYSLFCITKWVLAEIFLGSGSIANAVGHVMNRTINKPDPDFSYFKVIQLNIQQLIGYHPVSQVLVGAGLLLLCIGFLKFRKKRFDMKVIGYWLAVGLIPYLWFIVASNHSYLHVWYTYRAQFMTIVAGVMIYRELVVYNRKMINQEYNAVVLAGGFGTRLGINKPKGLIETDGKTLLGRLIEEMEKCPWITSVVLVSNQMYFDQFEKWLKEYSGKLKINLINDGAANPEERLGAIGDMLLATKQIKRELPTLVCASDTFFDFSLADLLELREKYNQFTSAVYVAGKERIAGRLGCVEMEGDQVIGFEEKPPEPKSDYASVPFYVFNPGMKQLLEQYSQSGRSMDAPGNLIPWLLENNFPVYALVAGKVVDVGTKEDVDRLGDKSC